MQKRRYNYVAYLYRLERREKHMTEEKLEKNKKTMHMLMNNEWC